MLYRVLLIILLFRITPAQATTAIAVSDAQQALLSDAVVIAVVGEHQHQVNPRYNMIETHTTLHIEELLYGTLPPQPKQEGLVLIQAGGTIGDRFWKIEKIDLGPPTTTQVLLTPLCVLLITT